MYCLRKNWSAEPTESQIIEDEIREIEKNKRERKPTKEILEEYEKDYLKKIEQSESELKKLEQQQKENENEEMQSRITKRIELEKASK